MSREQPLVPPSSEDPEERRKWMFALFRALRHHYVERGAVTTVSVAPSEVVGTDGKNYTCWKQHTSALANKPITGGFYPLFWYEAGSAGGVWAVAQLYSDGTYADVVMQKSLQAGRAYFLRARGMEFLESDLESFPAPYLLTYQLVIVKEDGTVVCPSPPAAQSMQHQFRGGITVGTQVWKLDVTADTDSIQLTPTVGPKGGEVIVEAKVIVASS